MHLLLTSLAAVAGASSARGRTDCPGFPAYDGVDVTVVEVAPDGDGGMVAAFVAPWDPSGTAPGRVNRWPVCTVGSQDDEPLECCLIARENSQYVQCKDPDHRIHGMTAEEAVNEGFTLELCVPPPSIPSCCVELGQFPDDDGVSHNGRLVCDDPDNIAHRRPVDVVVSADGTEASISFPVGDASYDVTVPVCEIDDVPEEIPCCLKDGRVWCPDSPDYHGMTYEEFQEVSGGALHRCPDEPPPPPPPDECCVQEDGASATILCADERHPLHGYELKPGEFTCYQLPTGRVCEVDLGYAPQGPCFDVESNKIVGGPHDGVVIPQSAWSVTQDGGTVSVSVGGDATTEFPICTTRRVRFRACLPPPPPPPPPNCCYDVATGTLVCEDARDSYNGMAVALEDLGETSARVVVGGQSLQVGICKYQVPPACCFEAAEIGAGAVGTLVCPTSPALDGLAAVLVSVRDGTDGTLIANVSWAGGGGEMPVCRGPEKECPECDPPYFCCVNVDTGVFVCPGNPQRHGTAADIVNTEEIDGGRWVRLKDGTQLPACGASCPPPRPCPDGPRCPPCPECEDHPPPRVPPPCDPTPCGSVEPPRMRPPWPKTHPRVSSECDESCASGA